VDRELLFGVLVATLCAPSVWFFSAWPLRSPAPGEEEITNEEGRRWRELVSPVLPGAVIFAGLLGWAISEPADAEPASYLTVAILPAGIVWLRAIARAIRAALPAQSHHAAATVGLLRPRVVLREGLADLLDPEALGAAKAHEEAHVRHRDPLKMWAAQMVTDLQWPCPNAGRRFRLWLHALEIARDDEAVAAGVDPLDLAKAIVTCAAAGQHSTGALSSVAGEASLLPLRVRRLLEPRAHRPPRKVGAVFIPAILGLVVVAFISGIVFGERLVGALLGALA
jgi:hypothetical protein